MNIVEALQTGKPIRRPVARHLGSAGNGWLGNEYVLSLLSPNERVVSFLGYDVIYPIVREDILANDWEAYE